MSGYASTNPTYMAIGYRTDIPFLINAPYSGKILVAPIIAPSSLPKMHCLLVEDSPAFTLLISKAVMYLGEQWQIKTVTTGAAALAAIDQFDVELNLLLVDLGLPDMHGSEIIRIAHDNFPELPIMVISSISSEDSLFRAIRAGASGYVVKDDSALSISQAIARILAGDFPVSPMLAQYLFRLAGSAAPTNTETLPNLTGREIEMLQLLAVGLSYQEVANEMNIALSTVQFHIRNLYRKLHVTSQAQALAKARESGIM